MGGYVTSLEPYSSPLAFLETIRKQAGAELCQAQSSANFISQLISEISLPQSTAKLIGQLSTLQKVLVKNIFCQEIITIKFCSITFVNKYFLSKNKTG